MGVVAAEAVEQHGDGQLIGDEFAALHVALRLLAQLGLIADVLAEHVAGGEVEQFGVVGDRGGLGAFAGAGRAKQDDVCAHRMNPS